MALPVNYPTNEIAVCAYMADLSTAGSTFTVAPVRGKIVRVYSAIGAAITTGNGTWTMEINGTAVTGVSVTVTQSGSAAGDVDSATPTGANNVNEGDTIEFITDGACDTTCPTNFVAIIRPF